MKLEQEQQPVARHLCRVYRFGTAAVGVILLVFGIIGFTGDLPYFGTGGHQVLGMSSNGALSTVSVVAAVILLGAAAVGGNFASTVALGMSLVFLIGGTANFALIRTSANFLNFRLSNVLFSYAMVLLLALVGSYGRFTGGLDRDNPYWQARHPDQARHDGLRAQHLHELQEIQHPALSMSEVEATSTAALGDYQPDFEPDYEPAYEPSADSIRAYGAADAVTGLAQDPSRSRTGR